MQAGLNMNIEGFCHWENKSANKIPSNRGCRINSNSYSKCTSVLGLPTSTNDLVATTREKESHCKHLYSYSYE